MQTVKSMRKAIIVGATSGIGLEVAKILRGEGIPIGVAGRREDKLKAFAGEGGSVMWQRIDVTGVDAGERLVDLAERMGGVDTILLVAGIGSQNRVLDPSVEIATAETNVVGFTRMVDAAFNYLKSHGGGHIGAVSSIAGTKGLGIAPAYSATKRFQNTYLQCLAQLSSMTGANVTITDIRPGFVDTDLLRSGSYPMLMKPDKVARSIVSAMRRRKRVATIDWRYRMLVAVWKLIPDSIWEMMKIQTRK